MEKTMGQWPGTLHEAAYKRLAFDRRTLLSFYLLFNNVKFCKEKKTILKIKTNGLFTWRTI